VNYSDGKNSALIEQLVSSIKLGKQEQSISSLQLLLEAYSSDIEALENKPKNRASLDKIFKIINDEPFMFFGILILYIFMSIRIVPKFRDSLNRITGMIIAPNKAIKRD
jgi:hypothetical protein